MPRRRIDTSNAIGRFTLDKVGRIMVRTKFGRYVHYEEHCARMQVLLDLVAALLDSPTPPPEVLARARQMLEYRP